MATAASQKWVFDSIRQIDWNGPVIDLGAGGFEEWYKGLFHDAEYKTLDIKQNKDKTIDIISDIHHMTNVASESFGVVLLLDTLEHLPFPHLAFMESARILKPGGLFICTTVACWDMHDHPVDYWRFLPDGLVFLCRFVRLKPFVAGIKKVGEEGRMTCSVSAVKSFN